MKKEKLSLTFKYNGRSEFDRIRGQRINHLVYVNDENDKEFVEVLDYEEI